MLPLFIIGAVVAPFAVYWIARRNAARKAQAVRANTQKKLKDRVDSQRLPYRYADDQIFISGNSVWTAVTLAPTTDEYRTASEKQDAAQIVANTYQMLLSCFGGEPVYCHEQIRYRPKSADEWERTYLAELWHPSSFFKRLIRQVSGLLAESTPERQRFLMVRLGDFDADSVPDPLSSISGYVTGVADEHFQASDLQPFRDLAARVHAQLAVFRASPCTRGDLIWLIRKVLSGHRFPDEQPIQSSRPVRNSFFDMVANFHGRNGQDYVEIVDTDPATGEQRYSYTATLVVESAEPVVEYNPMFAWGPLLAQLPQPVELSWRYELLTAREFKKRAVSATENIADEERDRNKANAKLDPAFDKKAEEAADLFEDVSTNPQPAMVGRLRLVLSAPSPAGLAAAEHEVRTHLSDMEMIRVPRAQSLLLQEQLPGDYNGRIYGGLFGGVAADKRGGLTVGERITDVWNPAIARLDSDSQVGDRVAIHRGRPQGWRAFPIGYTRDTGSPVHFGLHVQLARSSGAGIAIVGSSGGGKTTLALLLYFWESESGTQCLVLDPKNDFEKFTYYIAFGSQVLHPQFADEAEQGLLGTEKSRFQPVNRAWWNDTTIINLSAGVPGQLSAWSMFPDSYSKADELARAQVEVMFSRDEQERTIVEDGLAAMREHWEAQQAGTLADGEQEIAPSLGCVKMFIELERNKYEEFLKQEKDVVLAQQKVQMYDRVLARFRRAQETQYARLLFGSDGDQSGLGNLSRRRVIFTMHGFSAPDDPENMQTWSETQRNASAVMVTTLTAVQGLFDDRLVPNPVTGRMGKPPRTWYIDEAYMITAHKPGKAAISKGLRQGRALNLAVVFISQQPHDINEIEQAARKSGDAEMNQFGSVFIFRQQSESEAMDALRLLRGTNSSEGTPEVENLAGRLLEEGKGNGILAGGVCVMRDVDGRVATVAVDQMFEELARATETNAQERTRVQSDPISGDPDEWEIDPTTMLLARTGVLDSDEQEPGSADHIEWDPEWVQYFENHLTEPDDDEAADSAVSEAARR